MSKENPPKASKEMQAEIRRLLDSQPNDVLYEDIDRCRALIRHPFAQSNDVVFLRTRMRIARSILCKRMRYALSQL